MAGTHEKNAVLTLAERREHLREALAVLEEALTFVDRIQEERIYFAGICKCFETALEYAWKYLKARAIEEGMEVFSPKEAVKTAGQAGWVGDVEEWLLYINSRNLAVHDYLSIAEDEYIAIIQNFVNEARALVSHSGRLGDAADKPEP